MRLLFTILALLACAACSHKGEHGGLTKTIEAANEPSTNGQLNLSSAFDNVQRVKVEGTKEVPPFEALSRTASMKKFPCEKCHNKPLDVLKRAPAGKKASHWDVKLVHASEATMACATCHLKTDLNKLGTLTGKPVELNHGYQVCAQCHSKQAADWAGGAHGKRTAGWAPPRVVWSCPACHDPHNPKLAPRWPALAQKRDARFESQEAQ